MLRFSIERVLVFFAACLFLMPGCSRQPDPPPFSEWVDHELSDVGLAVKLPASTGGDMEKQVPRSSESVVSQVGNRLFFANVTPPSGAAQSAGFDPSNIKKCEDARKAWEYSSRRSEKFHTVQPSAVQVIKNLSGPDGNVHGFVSRLIGSSDAGQVYIRMQTIYLPDGSVLDMQTICPEDEESDKARAKSFFDSVRLLPDGLRGTFRRTQTPQLTWKEARTKAKTNPSNRAIARTISPVGFMELRDFRDENRYQFRYPKRLEGHETFSQVGYDHYPPAGRSRTPPLVVVLADRFRDHKKYASLTLAFEKTGFARVVPYLLGVNRVRGNYTDEEKVPFDGFVGEVDRVTAVIQRLVEKRLANPDRVYVVGFGTGGHLAGLVTLQSDITVRETASIGGGYARFDKPEWVKELYENRFDATPESWQARSLLGHLDELQTNHLLFSMDKPPAANLIAAKESPLDSEKSPLGYLLEAVKQRDDQSIHLVETSRVKDVAPVGSKPPVLAFVKPNSSMSAVVTQLVERWSQDAGLGGE